MRGGNFWELIFHKAGLGQACMAVLAIHRVVLRLESILWPFLAVAALKHNEPGHIKSRLSLQQGATSMDLDMLTWKDSQRENRATPSPNINTVRRVKTSNALCITSVHDSTKTNSLNFSWAGF
ncbi:hypothetical protein RJT34_07815 [Clitoria ternatea]|uniref:Uncharacterized protein n=1 Tax=Clitoria ternatea TaxID=43366 RepID=A0AAN9PV89_CLITE